MNRKGWEGLRPYGEVYGKTSYGMSVGMSGDNCYHFCRNSTMVDLLIRNKNKNICFPHGLELLIYRKFSGMHGSQHKNTDMGENNIRGLPVQPNLEIRKDYLDYAWKQSNVEYRTSSMMYVKLLEKGDGNSAEEKLLLQEITKKKTNKELPIEDLTDWYV